MRRGDLSWIRANGAGKVEQGLDFLGVAGAATLFGIAHIYQGRRGVLATSVVGGIFSVARIWTGSLIPAVISHFAADFVVGFMAPNRLQAAGSGG